MKMKSRTMSIHGVPIRVIMASTFFDRLLGVFRYPLTNTNTALWIIPCSAIHTFGCGPMGVCFLDEDMKVVKMKSFVPRNRIVWCKNAKSVIEFPLDSPFALYQPNDVIKELTSLR